MMLLLREIDGHKVSSLVSVISEKVKPASQVALAYLCPNTSPRSPEVETV